jgi:hypothetical protein
MNTGSVVKEVKKSVKFLKVEIPMYDGTNYGDWSKDVRKILESRGELPYIDGENGGHAAAVVNVAPVVNVPAVVNGDAENKAAVNNEVKVAAAENAEEKAKRWKDTDCKIKVALEMSVARSSQFH